MLIRFLAVMAFLFIRIYTKLLRYTFFDRHHSILAIEENKGVIYAFYHGKQLALFAYPVAKPMVQMVSLSKDGGLQSQILHWLGFVVVRGSAGKNGKEALNEMTDFVLKGCNAALAIDGSKGPLHEVKSGIIHLARDSGAVIIPIASHSEHKMTLKSTWDKYEIPLPLTRVYVMEGEAIEVDAEIDDSELEVIRKNLELKLSKLHENLENRVKSRKQENNNNDDEK